MSEVISLQTCKKISNKPLLMHQLERSYGTEIRGHFVLTLKLSQRNASDQVILFKPLHEIMFLLDKKKEIFKRSHIFDNKSLLLWNFSADGSSLVSMFAY